MKKLCNLILTLLLAASVLLLSFGCGGASLGTPGNLVVNDDLMLSWAAVQSARSYRLEIVNVESGERQENVVQRTSYDLAKLPEGDYELRLRAVGGSENDVYSAWSEVYPFHRDKESGLLFTSVEGNTAYEVRSVGSASGDVEIERIYRDKPVVGIGQTAFRGSSKLTRITIPDTVTYIGASAFYNCSGLLSVEIPASVVSIGRAAFQQCSSLSSISLPAAITRIESFTFAYCRALPEISLSEQIVFIGESAFSNCSAVTELTVPDSVQTIGPNAFRQMTGLTRVSLGSGLRSFGDSAFYGCTALKDVEFSPLEGEMVLSEAAFADCSALQSVSLPKGVTRIETNCFTNDVALESVVIPSGVSEIEPNAFYHSKLYDEQMASGDGLVYAGNWVIDATEDYKKTVTDLNETTFREGTVGIADFAFRYTWQVEVEVEVEDENGEIVTETRTRVETVSCEKLRRISFPSSMKYIGQGAFYHAPVLQRVLATYEDSLERVGSYAFAYCPMLNNVRFATGLKEIETRAFFQCELLDYSDNNPELLIPTSVTRVGENAFYGTALWYRDDITDGVVYAGNWVVGYHLDPAFEGEEPQSLIELREGTVGICDYGFYGVQTLQNITGLNRVERIGTGAFAYCTRLATISLNRNLRVIEPYTFYKCKSIYTVSFPSMLRTIGKDAFYQCEQLSAIDLLDTQVSEVGDSAFRECKNLRSIEFGEHVERIGKYAFYGCTLLTELVIPDTVTELGVRAFSDCLSLHAVSLGAGLTSLPNYAFFGCVWLRGLTVPANIKEIGDYAFYGCTRLGEFTLEEGLERIGSYAFYGNERLTHAEIPASVTSIGVYAFKGCTALEGVLLKGTPAYIGDNAFYACPRLTIYGVGAGEGEDWSALWDSSQRPVVWNVTLSEDGSFVSSVTVGENTHPHARFGYAGPGRTGYVFAGWSTEPEGEAEYTAAQLETLPVGTTVYSVWEPAPEEDEDAWWNEFVEWLRDLLMQESGGLPQAPGSGEQANASAGN